MARIGGRNAGIAWVVGLVCAAVVAGLVVLALPALPAAVFVVGETLRAGSATQTPVASASRSETATETPECRAIYPENLWAELRQRAGGDPVQTFDAAAEMQGDAGAALAPVVRVTCAFAGVNAGAITTTVADVAGLDEEAVAETLTASGFVCTWFGSGQRCTRDDGAVRTEQLLRDDVWVVTVFDGWEPSRYAARLAQRLWAD